MHASVSADSDHSIVLRDAKAILAERFGITHATIQIEVEDCADAGEWRCAATGKAAR